MRKTNIVPWTALIEMYHIGSTSVKSIGFAKPIIDILIVVNNIELIDQYNKELELLGYEPRGENSISGRRFFLKGKENRTHHIPIFQVGKDSLGF